MTKTYNVGKFFQSEIHQQPTLEDIFPNKKQESQQSDQSETKQNNIKQKQEETPNKSDKVQPENKNIREKSTNAKKTETANNKSTTNSPNNIKSDTGKRRSMISDKVGTLKPSNKNEQLPFSVKIPKIHQQNDVNIYRQCKSTEKNSNEISQSKQPSTLDKKPKETQENIIPQRKSIITEETQNHEDFDSDSGDMFDPKKVCRSYEFPSGKN